MSDRSQKRWLQILFWGWPVVFVLLMVTGYATGTTMDPASPNELSDTLIRLGFICELLYVAFGLFVVGYGVVRQRLKKIALLGALGHYVFLLFLYVVLFYPFVVLAFILAGGEFITSTDNMVWLAVLAWHGVVLAVWLPLSGRAMLRMVLQAFAETG